MFYIIEREKKSAWAVHDADGCDTYHDAKYTVDAMKEQDEKNGEEWEYKIIEVRGLKK